MTFNPREYHQKLMVLDAVEQRVEDLRNELRAQASLAGYCPHPSRSLVEKTTFKDLREDTQIYVCRACKAKLIVKKGILNEVIQPE